MAARDLLVNRLPDGTINTANPFNWSRFAQLIAGAVVTGIATGHGMVTAALGGAFSRVFGGVAAFGAEFLDALLTDPAVALTEVWRGTTAFAAVLGPGSGPYAVAVVAVGVFVYVWVVRDG